MADDLVLPKPVKNSDLLMPPLPCRGDELGVPKP
jgi:hypothetical protein